MKTMLSAELTEQAIADALSNRKIIVLLRYYDQGTIVAAQNI